MNIKVAKPCIVWDVLGLLSNEFLIGTLPRTIPAKGNYRIFYLQYSGVYSDKQFEAMYTDFRVTTHI